MAYANCIQRIMSKYRKIISQIAGLGECNVILVYSKTEEQHEKHLREVLETLRRERPFCKVLQM